MNMDVSFYSIMGLIVLIIAGFFAIGAILFGIESLIEHRRASRAASKAPGELPDAEAGTYGPEECYRDCTRTNYPYSANEYPSCAEACGLSK